MGRMSFINNIKEMFLTAERQSHTSSKDGIYYIFTDKEKANKESINSNNDMIISDLNNYLI
jgi:hypothetical protein